MQTVIIDICNKPTAISPLLIAHCAKLRLINNYKPVPVIRGKAGLKIGRHITGIYILFNPIKTFFTTEILDENDVRVNGNIFVIILHFDNIEYIII